MADMDRPWVTMLLDHMREAKEKYARQQRTEAPNGSKTYSRPRFPFGKPSYRDAINHERPVLYPSHPLSDPL